MSIQKKEELSSVYNNLILLVTDLPCFVSQLNVQQGYGGVATGGGGGGSVSSGGGAPSPASPPPSRHKDDDHRDSDGECVFSIVNTVYK